MGDLKPLTVKSADTADFVKITDGVNEATVDPANTARNTGTVVQTVQEVDATGKVSPAGESEGNAPFVKITDGVNEAAVDPANTARTTGTVVQTVQEVDATGKVSPAGEIVSNAPYSNATIQNPNWAHVLDEKLLNAVTATGESTDTDTLSYKELVICIVASSVTDGATFTFQGSPDNTNYGTVASINIIDLVSATQEITANGTYYFEIVNASSLKYFRANLTTYVDGTYTVYISGRA